MMPEMKWTEQEEMMEDQYEVASQDQQHVMGTYARQPLHLVRGEGMYVYDADDIAYLDFTSGIAVSSLGHCHPALVNAVTTQANTLWHTSNLYLTTPQANLAAKLTEASGFDRVFFANSGAEANEAAIKLARRYSKKIYGAHKGEIITFTHAFHGRTIATVTATPQVKYQEGFGPLPSGFRYVEEFTLDAVKAAISAKTCAVMIEPIQGEGGVRPVPPEFLLALRQLCDMHGLLLIFDEVQTGAGRTGSWLAWQCVGVKPDILTMAKGLGGGLPIGAMMADAVIASVFTPGTHGSTFGGNPIAASAAVAVIDTIMAPGFLEQVRRRGQQLYGQLQDLALRFPDSVQEVRGMGLMWGVVLQGIDAGHVMNACREQGLLVLTAGGNTIRLLPPLIVSSTDIEKAISILGNVIKEAIG